MKHACPWLVMIAGCGSVAELPQPDAALDASTDAPPAEVCNGIDDDLEGTIDEGCPAEGALAFGPGTTSAIVGGESTFGQAGTPLERQCPLGSIVIGLHGRAYESIDALGVLCGVPAIVHSVEAPFTYAIQLADGATLPAVGGSGGTPFEARCAPGAAVVGATVEIATTTNGTSIYGVTLECSAFAIEHAETAMLARAGDPVVLARFATGNASVPTEPTPVGCPAGEMLGGVSGAYGPWPLYSAYTIVNAVRLHCVKPTIRVIGA